MFAIMCLESDKLKHALHGWMRGAGLDNAGESQISSQGVVLGRLSCSLVQKRVRL